ncbi:CubicO group peptidase (beta-lactamase class C family) [Desulfobotulus alkaliphilus]|uniref:CubicO group peptidase (Beta-lactamase class C family) n=1 Tax=Desulfobotulus alkaliphilus TaxID=622671 RepID=A0A562RGI6_9BACT|nr:serine hydrolase domain-containing protein [Desulfobotulus alkaliphilus]TWI68212.1 CubicO group peptidase (beta-lactamase class C family) [Desulfobotulus alkaliphilus]
MVFLDHLLQEGVDQRVFSAVSAWVGVDGHCVYAGNAGCLDPATGVPVTGASVFDLASLTKVLGTTPVLMHLVAEGRISPEDRLCSYLPEWRGDKAREGIRIHHLLQHTSGLPAHRPFYQELEAVPESLRREERLRLIRNIPLECCPGQRTLYSDLGFMLLKEVVENVTGEAFGGRVMAALPPGAEKKIFFPVPGGGAGVDCACTGESPVRKRRLTGEVHDENAAFIGGVDGQAGLFGTASGVGEVGQALVEAWHGMSLWLPASVLHRFIFWPEDGKRPLGFDRPSGTVSSCGSLFSKSTAGHLGFTGTSLWMDMKKKIVVVLLSNRVYYGDLNWKIRSFRPRFHDCVMQTFGQA